MIGKASKLVHYSLIGVAALPIVRVAGVSTGLIFCVIAVVLARYPVR
jgi:hypothetical protein